MAEEIYWNLCDDTGLMSFFTDSGTYIILSEIRYQRGILIASGLIAGGALMGVVNAALGVGFGMETMPKLHILSDHHFEGMAVEGLHGNLVPV